MLDSEDWRRIGIIAGLGTTQTLAWASSYYLVAIVAEPMARALGTGTTTIFAAFSVSLLVAALVGPRVGRTIDVFGGREILAASNLIFAAGLAMLALAQGQALLWLGWLVVGLAMGLGLYDTAFAALGRLFGEGARSSITGITLIAGFASTVGWPVSAWLDAEFGWRVACLAWAASHLVVSLPLNLLGLPKPDRSAPGPISSTPAPGKVDLTMWLLGFAFAAGWFVSTAMAAHLPRLLESAGATTAEAVAAAALVGPAQVAGRVLEASVFSRRHPLFSARLSTIAHPIGAGLLLFGGGSLGVVFSLLHGVGNGILTIARGTVPLAVFGPANYGYRLGVLGAPARIAQAGAPLAFGAAIEAYGTWALLISAALCLATLVTLVLVRPRSP